MIGLFRWQDFLDIFIISFIVYRLLILLVDTRAMQLVKGIFVLGVLASAARILELQALSWLLGKSLTGLFIAIPIVFQPELRRVLEELGRGKIWQRRQAQEKAEQLADEITRALIYLQGQKIGALVVSSGRQGSKMSGARLSASKLKFPRNSLSRFFGPTIPFTTERSSSTRSTSSPPPAICR